MALDPLDLLCSTGISVNYREGKPYGQVPDRHSDRLGRRLCVSLTLVPSAFSLAEETGPSDAPSSPGSGLSDEPSVPVSSGKASEPAPIPGAKYDADGKLTALPEGGEWVAYNPIAGRKSAVASAAALVRPIERACPSGTSNYPANKRNYNCLSTYRDNGNSGHSVGLREGRSRASSNSPFGYLHHLRDHGLDEETVGTVIVNNAAGRAQGNQRFLYGLQFRVADVGLISVEVVEDRKPSSTSPDNYALGVVTAYCKGISGQCPDGINETLP